MRPERCPWTPAGGWPSKSPFGPNPHCACTRPLSQHQAGSWTRTGFGIRQSGNGLPTHGAGPAPASGKGAGSGAAGSCGGSWPREGARPRYSRTARTMGIPKVSPKLHRICVDGAICLSFRGDWTPRTCASFRCRSSGWFTGNRVGPDPRSPALYEYAPDR